MLSSHRPTRRDKTLVGRCQLGISKRDDQPAYIPATSMMTFGLNEIPEYNRQADVLDIALRY